MEGTIRRLHTYQELKLYHNFRVVFASPLLRPTPECMKYSDKPPQYLTLINMYFVIVEIIMSHPGPLCKAGSGNLCEEVGPFEGHPFGAIPTAWMLWVLTQSWSSQGSQGLVPLVHLCPTQSETPRLSYGFQFNCHALSTGLRK